jgi:diacylglycerol kinase family enzyme
VRITLIHNPKAGKQARGSRDKLVKLLRSAGHEVRYQSSKDDAWADALEDPGELVVVAGGDGTVSRVAKRMVGRGIPVSLLPTGTANNIARTIGIVDLPFEEIVRAWRNPRRIKLDVGVVDAPWGKRYFVEGVGVGLFVRLLSGRKPDKKVAGDAVARGLRRLAQVARRCPAIALNASLDGKDISGRFVLLEAVNLLYVGPNLFLAPDSQPGDGHFDVVLVSEAERARLLEYLSKWQENRERLAVLPSHRGERLRIEWTGFSVHIDDKLWPKKKDKLPQPPATIEARIEGKGVEFLTAA